MRILLNLKGFMMVIRYLDFEMLNIFNTQVFIESIILASESGMNSGLSAINMLNQRSLTFIMPADEELLFLFDYSTSISQKAEFEYYVKEGIGLTKKWNLDRKNNSVTYPVRFAEGVADGSTALTRLVKTDGNITGYTNCGSVMSMETLFSLFERSCCLKILKDMENIFDYVI